MVVRRPQKPGLNLKGDFENRIVNHNTLFGLAASFRGSMNPALPSSVNETGGLRQVQLVINQIPRSPVQQTRSLEDGQHEVVSFVNGQVALVIGYQGQQVQLIRSEGHSPPFALHQGFTLTAPSFYLQVFPVIVPPVHAIA